MSTSGQKVPIDVSLISDPLLIERSLAFIADIALERHNATPPPPPQVLFSATDGDRVVGTIALDLSEGETPLPLEMIYAFAENPFTLDFHRREVAQFGRWMSSVPHVSLALAYIATIYALHKKKSHGLFEAKPFIAVRLAEIGMKLTPLIGGVLILERVPIEGRAYYIKPPVPIIYTMELVTFKASLQPQIDRLVSERIITLHTPFCE